MKINLKYYPQHKDYSCGPVCLRMVFEHLGKKYSEEKLINLCRVSEKYGLNHEHLIKEIENEGFEWYVKNKGTLKDLIRILESGYPAIVNFLDPFSNDGHFAVVTGYTEDKKEIILADPCNGNDFTIPWSEFKERWHNSNNTSKGWFVIMGRESINI